MMIPETMVLVKWASTVPDGRYLYTYFAGKSNRWSACTLADVRDWLKRGLVVYMNPAGM